MCRMEGEGFGYAAGGGERGGRAVTRPALTGTVRGNAEVVPGGGRGRAGTRPAPTIRVW